MRTKKDNLGTRMKENYENRSRNYFPRRSYTLVRIDGKAFHSWTRGLNKPFDEDLMKCMDETALELCKQVMGCQFAYIQSDEISLLLTDFKDIATQAWFDGNQSKIESITASIATMAFNKTVTMFSNLADGNRAICKKEATALFDSRAWTIADRVEVANYFIWRQQDAERNSLSMLASKYATHKQLHGKNAADRHEIIHKAGDNWNDISAYMKRGRTVIKSKDNTDPTVSTWQIDSDIPIFTLQPTYLKNLIPELGT